MNRSTLLTTLVVTAAFVLASETVLNWLRYSHTPPIIWFASGVAVAAVLLAGPRALIGIWIGAFICALLADASPLLGLFTASTTTVEVALVWWLLVRVCRCDIALPGLRDVLLLLAIGVLVIPTLNALATIALGAWRGMLDAPDYILRIEVTAMGEAVGILLVLPLALTLFRGVRPARPGGRRVEAWVLHVVNLAVAMVVFGGMLSTSMSAESLPYALFPITFWAAFRLGLRDTAIALFVSGVIAVACHSLGVGPFVMARGEPSNAFSHYASLYLFLVVLCVTSLLAAAIERQRRDAEGQVRASEARYRMLIERMNEGVNITDAQARMTFVSDRFCEMLGFAREELLGKTGEMLTIPEQREEWGRAHRQREAGAGESHSLALRRKDGELRHMWISPSPQFDDDGNYAGSLNVVLDVTDRLQAEERARSHLDQLAHVSRVASMGEMASAIAHEINQPLTAIANYASASLRLMQAGNLSPEEATVTLQRLAAEAERAGEVVRKMRGFVRGDEGHPAPVGVEALLGDVLRLCGPEARQSEVELAIEADPFLPPVLADAIQIQQVLLNLVRNAVEAIAAADSVPRRVTLSAKRGSGAEVEISVTDTGPGLPADGLEKVFEPFFTTKADGIGIGLALSRSIVDAHGGRLWASAATHGAAFHLTLPITADPGHVTA